MNFEKTRGILTKYSLPLPKEQIIKSKSEVFSFAKKIGYPVVLKIFSPKILHKTDIGGVILDIENRQLLFAAWKKISKLAQKEKAEILIQKQEKGTEVIIGAKRDPTFGPIIMFGLGGIFTEILKDISFRLAPINRKEARQMIAEIKGYEILKGARGQRPINFQKLEEILLSLSDLMIQEKQIEEIDLNPVIIDSRRAVIVDAKIVRGKKIHRESREAESYVKISSINSALNPKTVAVIGATDRNGSVGRGLVKNLLEGKSVRKIFMVNPHRKKVFNYKTYSNIKAIQGKIDLALVAVPAKIVPKIIKECCKKKVKSIIVISSGFKETGKEGTKLEEEIKFVISKCETTLIGPNCLGVLRPSAALNASFAPSSPRSGEIALISQSGALLDSIINSSVNKSYGFSAIISYGNEADLGLNDFLIWAEKDKKTKVIALYLEGLKAGRRFFEIAKRVSGQKPIVVLKGGKAPASKRAVSSHTGALAGAAQIYSAAFRQAGLIEVQSLEELLDISKALSSQPRCKNGIGIVTNGGGAGILAADYCHLFGIKLPKLASATKNKIDNSKGMHPGWSRNNPVDIVGDALSSRYETAINSLLSQKDIFGLIVIQTLQVMTEPMKNAKIILRAKKKYPEKPIVTVFMGIDFFNPVIKFLEKNKIPNYPDPLRAVRATRALVRWS